MRSSFLIIDDDTCLLKAIARVLRPEPLEIVFADDPCAAIELCRVRSFEVVLSDFMMPAVNGVELLRAVRELLPNTVRMLLTAHCESRLITTALADQTVTELLEKPFKLDRLRSAIRAAAAS